ncbi:phosphotransferase [Paenibacillus sp. P26]|nr:phosphotransferase [Paenibacillus sp. P26]UUZ92285.1 phosphotransferase [Paenibacillus sp. P25]
MNEEAVILGILREMGLTDERIAAAGDILRESGLRGLASETVISHGDLYPLNVVSREGELIILDWEYIHLNSVYWDLYNLIDITSPSYRRNVVGRENRAAILGDYRSERESLGKRVSADFVRGYHYYCAVYSMWILLLIESDMKSRRFAEGALAEQRAETFQILQEMLDVLAEPEG